MVLELMCGCVVNVCFLSLVECLIVDLMGFGNLSVKYCFGSSRSFKSFTFFVASVFAFIFMGWFVLYNVSMWLFYCMIFVFVKFFVCKLNVLFNIFFFRMVSNVFRYNILFAAFFSANSRVWMNCDVNVIDVLFEENLNCSVRLLLLSMCVYFFLCLNNLGSMRYSVSSRSFFGVASNAYVFLYVCLLFVFMYVCV